MKTIRNIAVVLLFSGAALASSHREAPAIANDPAADNTDVYAFVTSKAAPNDTLNIVANWIPFEEPSGGPNFFKWSDDVQYAIHITQGTGPIKDNIVYKFYFKTAAVAPIADSSLMGPLNTACPTADSDPVKCIGGGKEFFSQLTGPSTGGAIVQTYTVVKSVNGVDQAPLTNTATGFNGAFISVPANIGPRTQAILHAVAPTLVGSATYDEAFTDGFIGTTAAADGTRIFAGPRDDGFYVDLGGVFDLANLRPRATAGACKPANDGVAPGTPKCLVAQDGLAGYNVHSIAIEIPTKQLTSDGKAPTVGAASDVNTMGIWATSSRREVTINRRSGVTNSFGPWVQVSRLGLPLINEAVIGYQDKDKYNRTKPSADVPNFGAYILNPVIVPDYEAACAASTALGLPGACAYTATEKLRHGRTDIIDVISLAATGCATYNGTDPTKNCHHVALADGSTGDVLRVDLNLDPTVAGTGFPNGRSLINTADRRKEGADVTDVELSLLLGGVPALGANGANGGPPAIQDGVEYNDKQFLSAFPWLALPWEGYSEGHGRGTP
jgi:hypothetical protein